MFQTLLDPGMSPRNRMAASPDMPVTGDEIISGKEALAVNGAFDRLFADIEENRQDDDPGVDAFPAPVPDDAKRSEHEAPYQVTPVGQPDQMAGPDTADDDLVHVREGFSGDDRGQNQPLIGMDPGQSGLRLPDSPARADALLAHAWPASAQTESTGNPVAVSDKITPEADLALVHGEISELAGGMSRDPGVNLLPQMAPTIGKVIELSAGSEMVAPTKTSPVHRQLSDTILRMQGDVVELALSPEELGRVRIMIARGPDGLMISLLADRVQTLELLRENSTALHQELMAAGEDEAQLSFGDAGQGEGAETAGQDDRPGLAGDEVGALLSEAGAEAAGMIPAGRLDIRM